MFRYQEGAPIIDVQRVETSASLLLVRAVLDLPAERFACDADAGTSSQDLWTRKAPLKSIKYTLSSEKRN